MADKEKQAKAVAAKSRNPSALKNMAKAANETSKAKKGFNFIREDSKQSLATVIKYPTWFLDLDMKLRGGVVYGKLFEAWGPDHAGKTTLMYNVIESVQNFCHLCFTPIIDFVDFDTGEAERTCLCGKCEGGTVLVIFSEDRFDEYWAERNGVDTGETFFPMFPNTLEQGAAFSEKVVFSKAADLICIDSFAAFQAEEKIGRDMGDARPGTDARGITNYLSRFMSSNMATGVEVSEEVAETFKKFRPNDAPPLLRTTAFGTNQVRANVGGTGKYAPKYSTPGGYMLKHLRSQTVQIHAPANNPGIKDAPTTVVSEFKFKVVKNFDGVKGGIGSYRIYSADWKDNEPGHDNEAQRIFTVFEDAGLITKIMKGKTIKGYDYFGITFKTRKELLAALHNRGLQWFARFVFTTRYMLRSGEKISLESYDYNPFYKIESDGNDNKGLPKWKLVRRKSVSTKTSENSEEAETEGSDETSGIEVVESGAGLDVGSGSGGSTGKPKKKSSKKKSIKKKTRSKG